VIFITIKYINFCNFDKVIGHILTGLQTADFWPVFRSTGGLSAGKNPVKQRLKQNTLGRRGCLLLIA
jgi:hypothetical protein